MTRMFVSPEQLWAVCGGGNIAALVSTLARSEVSKEHNSADLVDLCNAARAMQVPDWQWTARRAGYAFDSEQDCWWDREGYGWETAEGLCEAEGLKPIKAEPVECWLVNDWLAAKLEAKGETVVRGFGQEIVWCRSSEDARFHPCLDPVIAVIAAEELAPENTEEPSP